MDPNANLAEQERIFERGLTRGATYYYADQSRLSELRKALDQWLIHGGFEPDWSKAPNAAKHYGR